jgi:hypothetical protein
VEDGRKTGNEKELGSELTFFSCVDYPLILPDPHPFSQQAPATCSTSATCPPSPSQPASPRS